MAKAREKAKGQPRPGSRQAAKSVQSPPPTAAQPSSEAGRAPRQSLIYEPRKTSMLGGQTHSVERNKLQDREIYRELGGFHSKRIENLYLQRHYSNAIQKPKRAEYE